MAAESTFSLGTADLTATLNFENSDNVTHLLVSGFTGANGDDLDTDDDGILDVTPWSAVVDSVALVETPGSGDQIYSTTTVGPDGTFVPGQVFRLPDGTGDFQIGAFDPTNGDDTPGASNQAAVVVPTAATIMAIQGAAHVSPLLGELVVTTGIVTAVDSNGFYIQDAVGDGDAATSDGIFVFTGSTPTVAVSNAAEVTGSVSEFFPGGAGTGNLPTTQISATDVQFLTAGNTLPAAVIIGANGRTPPTEIIEDLVSASGPEDFHDNFADYATDGAAPPFGVFDIATDGLDFYESLEGMLVTVEGALAVSGNSRFGEVFVVADNGAGATGLNARGGITIATDSDRSDFNPERLQIDPDSTVSGFALSNIDTGDQLGNVTGVIGYAFGNFELIPTADFTSQITPSSLMAEMTALVGGANQLTIASYNVLNLDPDDTDGDMDVANGRFDAIAAQIVDNLQAPDIIALQEVQDNNGSINDGTTAADVTLQTLVDAIAAAGGPIYSFVDNPGVMDGAGGGQPGGNIRTAFLYDDSRVDLVAGSVAALTGAAFAGSRVPLEATFNFLGEDVTLINVHSSSKGGSSPLFGGIQPPINGSEDERIVQSEAIKAEVDAILAGDVGANVVVLGDFNEFDFEDSVQVLVADGTLSNLSEDLPLAERYTFNFEGNAQSLDHVLVTGGLTQAAQIDIVHLNSELGDAPTRASDHDPSVAQLTIVPDVTIPEIQGAGHVSTFDGLIVETTGIVTAVDSRGFYLQDPNGDGNDDTSDGIFVSTGSTPTVQVGDAATVVGTVDEQQFGNDLSTTRITAVSSVDVLSMGNVLPEAVEIGGLTGRQVPTQFIISPDEADAVAEVDLADPTQANANFDPAEDPIDFFESLEGMLVTVETLHTVSGTDRFGQIFGVADQATGNSGLNARGGVTIGTEAVDGSADVNILNADFNAERIQINDDNGILSGFDFPDVTTGQTLTGITGVISYDFGEFQINPTETFVVEGDPLEAETTTLSSGTNALTIATYTGMYSTSIPRWRMWRSSTTTIPTRSMTMSALAGSMPSPSRS